MKILVTGYNGQLGYDVVHEGLKKGLDMIGIDREDLNLTINKDVESFIRKLNPDAIIHCAAYTAVDKSEEDREGCWDVNVNGTEYLATVAKEIDAKFIYISTDYVYDGEGQEPFVESDRPNPQGYYGLTKYEGEKKVKELLEKYFVVRTSWVFGMNGNNFVKTMLKLSESRDELNVVGDQIGSPTYTHDLAILLIDMIQSDKYGLYHASNEGFCSWSDFAIEAFHQAGQGIKVNPITTEEYPTPAVRPKNSRMSKQKLVENGFNQLPTWQDALKRYVAELRQEVKN